MDASAKNAVVESYVQAFGDASLDAIRAIFADNAVLEDPVGTEPRVGIEAIVDFYKTGFDMHTRLSLSGPVRCAGNAVAFAFRVTVGEMKIDVIDVFEFNDEGKVQSMKAYWGPENVS